MRSIAGKEKALTTRERGQGFYPLGWQAEQQYFFEANTVNKIDHNINDDSGTVAPVQASERAFVLVSDQVGDAEFLQDIVATFAGDRFGTCIISNCGSRGFEVNGSAHGLRKHLRRWDGPVIDAGVDDLRFAETYFGGETWLIEGLAHLAHVLGEARACRKARVAA